MKRLALIALGGFIFACAPMTGEKTSERLSEIEIKLTRADQKLQDLEGDIEKTNERIDKLTELISELRLEIERIKLKLGITDRTSVSARPSLKEEEAERIPPPPETERTEEPQEEEVIDSETAYKKAIELYSIKKLYEARNAFLDFIKRFPSDKYTDNAFFWIGKVYQELGDTSKAESVFKSLIEKCETGKLPDCNKLPDAYLMMMRINLDRGNTEEANKYYSVLIEKFPTSDAAVRAREQKNLMGE
jgi:TolA-binding protein